MRDSLKKLLERRALNITLGVLLGLMLAGGLVIWQTGKDKAQISVMRSEAMHPQTTNLGGPFSLINQDGKPVSDSDFRGKYLLVYFGYTFCPDMCPTGLSSIAHSLDDLGADASKVQPLFITIDPKRDTPAVLKNYVQSFNPAIQGLSGPDDQIAAVAKEYQVYYSREDMDDDSGEYMMDHSSLIYLMDPAGKYIASFPEDVAPPTLTKALRDAFAGVSPGTPTAPSPPAGAPPATPEPAN
jgi:protein SCO1/2